MSATCQPDRGLALEAQARIREVLSSVPALEQAILYGSHAMGTYRPGSDIDLSLYQQIDNPELIEHIQRVGKVFYRRSNR
ncbi:nucleotidyltransferase domain-containing protein [Halomonas sp. WWR20]